MITVVPTGRAFGLCRTRAPAASNSSNVPISSALVRVHTEKLPTSWQMELSASPLSLVTHK